MQTIIKVNSANNGFSIKAFAKLKAKALVFSSSILLIWSSTSFKYSIGSTSFGTQNLAKI